MSDVRKLQALAVLLPALALSACSSSSSDGGPVLESITVVPDAVALHPGETQQLTVIGHYDDLSSSPIASGVTFETSLADVATVSASGLVTAVGAGDADVTASISGRTAVATVSVTAVEVAGVVFDDDYAEGVTFAEFGGSTNALAVDATEHASGSASLRIAVPDAGYTGGALVAATPQDLSAFDAVTFWAKASQAATLNVAGLGNDATASPGYSAELTQIPLTTEWVKHVVPIPLPARATAVAGLFHVAEGSDEGAYTIWLDEIRFESLSGAELGDPTAVGVAWPTIEMPVGGEFQLAKATNTVTYALPALVLTNVSFRWLTLTSSNASVASVDADGLVAGLSEGTSAITAALGSLAASGEAPVTVTATPLEPTTAPPAPTAAQADVISLLSSVYTSVPVDTWRTDWSSAVLTDVTIDGDPMKLYTSLDFVGIETTGANLVDASAMTHFHVDVWTPDATTFRVKLVDFGADAAWGGGDDTEHELAFDATTTPALVRGGWVSLDIPFTSFANLANRAHLAQLIFSAVPAGSATVYVDNVYFYRASAPTAPTTAPPAPTAAQADVISLLSSVYTSVPVDTWRTDWSSAVLTDVTIDGDPMKLYTSLDFVGIETTGANLVDASAMTHFHVDVWTPDATTFRVKLVDFGADAAWGGGDDTEDQLAFDATTTPALVRGGWVSLDIPFTSFANLANRAHLAQLIFSAVPAGSATVYVDNVYHHR